MKSYFKLKAESCKSELQIAWIIFFLQYTLGAGSCAIDFKTKSVFDTKFQNSLSVFDLVPKHFWSES